MHSLPQAGEMVFLDASASIDRHNNPVYFLCTHHPSGALHLCVWVTSDNSQQTVTSCLETAKKVYFQMVRLVVVVYKRDQRLPN
jgi:hypothetical protein